MVLVRCRPSAGRLSTSTSRLSATRSPLVSTSLQIRPVSPTYTAPLWKATLLGETNPEATVTTESGEPSWLRSGRATTLPESKLATYRSPSGESETKRGTRRPDAYNSTLKLAGRVPTRGDPVGESPRACPFG